MIETVLSEPTLTHALGITPGADALGGKARAADVLPAIVEQPFGGRAADAVRGTGDQSRAIFRHHALAGRSSGPSAFFHASMPPCT